MVARLTADITSGKLPPTARLPTEQEMIAAFGASRTVIREALLRLRMMGLIESKKKKGSVITSPDLFGIMGKSLNPHVLDQETLREMFEIRLVLEIGMADFLFQRIKKEDLDELKKIVSNEPPATEYHLFNIEHEIAFHGKLYEITGNETLKKFHKMLLPGFDYVPFADSVAVEDMIVEKLMHPLAALGRAKLADEGNVIIFRPTI